MSEPTTLAELRQRCDAGETFKYLYFWGHTPQRDGRVSNSCFSQWFEAAFEVDGAHYATAEHYMMAEKARLFGDGATLAKVLAARTPGAAKAEGRKVAGFSEEVWLAHRFPIVCAANHAKFSQHPALRAFLLETGDKVLVEASPSDRIWGIGLSATAPAANDPNTWDGLNLLGFALMHTRHALT